MVVGHALHIGVPHIELVLSQAPFSLTIFDGNAGLFQMMPGRSREWLGARSLKNVIIFKVVTYRAQVVVLLGKGIPVAGLKDIVFQFRSPEGPVALISCLPGLGV